MIGANLKGNQFSGNYKEEKRKNLIQSGFIKFSEEIDLFYTDSFDDYALAQQANQLILVSPDKESYRKFKETYNKEIKII